MGYLVITARSHFLLPGHSDDLHSTSEKISDCSKFSGAAVSMNFKNAQKHAHNSYLLSSPESGSNWSNNTNNRIIQLNRKKQEREVRAVMGENLVGVVPARLTNAINSSAAVP